MKYLKKIFENENSEDNINLENIKEILNIIEDDFETIISSSSPPSDDLVYIEGNHKSYRSFTEFYRQDDYDNLIINENLTICIGIYDFLDSDFNKYCDNQIKIFEILKNVNSKIEQLFKVEFLNIRFEDDQIRLNIKNIN